MTTAIGVIPARYDSTRFPGKILTPLCGRPLILWVIDRARQASRLDEILVATDDERIADVVHSESGVEAVMTKPDHPSGTDRIAEAIRGREAGIIVNIQGDEPLIDPELVNNVAEVLDRDTVWDMATAATPVANGGQVNDPSVVKVVCDEQGGALYFSRAPVPFERDRTSGTEPALSLYRRHIGLYAYRRAFLERLVQAPPCDLEQAEKLEQLRALYIGGRIHVSPARDVGPGVDTPADVVTAECALREAGLVD